MPPPLERAVFCLASALCLIALFAFWHPIAGTVWSVENEAARMVLWALFFAGWGILFIATHLINHWELFGLAQAWRHFRGTEAAPQTFRTPLFYRWVRHPIYSGFLLAFWATPEMSYGHLLLAVGFSVYIFIGIAFEERDLIGHYGEVYGDYRQRVGMVIPGIGTPGLRTRPPRPCSAVSFFGATLRQLRAQPVGDARPSRCRRGRGGCRSSRRRNRRGGSSGRDRARSAAPARRAR